MLQRKRKLAALLSADVVGFSRLMENDDVATVRSLKEYRQVFVERIAAHGGRMVDCPGDAVLAEFGSAIDVVQCAVEVQAELAQRNAGIPEARRMQCRIGIDLGDVIEEDGNLFGDGVNIASRLQALAPPAGICVSGKVVDEVSTRVEATFELLGEKKVKNISKPLRTYVLHPQRRLALRLLGEMQVLRGGEPLPLPQSKKTRALLAYLVLTQRAQRRERLCSLLWDIPDDPRGALRWSLSKLRPLVDEPDHPRLVADRETVRFESAGADVDVLALRSQLASGGDDLSIDDLRALAATFRGELLEGLELTEFQDFYAWCVAEREQIRRSQTVVLAALLQRLGSNPEEALPYARALVEVEPLDLEARKTLVQILARTGRTREAEQQCEIAGRLLSQLGRPGSAELVALAQSLHGAEVRSSLAGGAVPTGAPAPLIAEDRELASSPRAEWGGVAPPQGVPLEARDDPSDGYSDPIMDEKDGVLVGRQRERDLVLGALDAAEQSRKLQCVLLTGEAGVGKTRLLHELLAAARSRSATALFGCAYEVERSDPYGPWIDALRQVPASLLGRSLSDELAPLLRRTAGNESEGRTRERLFGAVVELVAARAHRAAVVLILDDIQWCDPASIELLHYVTRLNRNRPVVVALAARAGELADNTLALRYVRQLHRDVALREVQIEPLSREETAALVDSVAVGLDADKIFFDSAGNPLFALELARSLALDPDTRPHSLHELVRERVDRLPPAAADALRWAAVLGPAFRARRLAGLLELDNPQLLEALATLERHALVRAPKSHGNPGEDYVFAHQLVHHVTYTDLSEPRRRLMHLRVAQAIESEADAPEGAVNEIVHHAALAGEYALAARACVEAGRRCLRLFANTEAHTFSRRGLHYAEHLPEPQRIPVLIDLTAVSVASRRPSDLDAAARSIGEMAERALDHGCIEHACRGFHLAGHLRWEYGDWSDAQRQLLRAEAVSRSAGDEANIVAMAEAGRCLAMLERDLGQAESLALEARARAQRAHIDPMAIPQTLGMLRLHQGKLDEAELLLREALLAAGRDGDHLGEFQALEHLMMLAWQREDHAAVARFCAELCSIAAKLREGSEAPFAKALAALASYACDEEIGDGELEAALGGLRIADAKHRLAYVLTRAANVDVRRKRTTSARVRAQEAFELAGALGRPSEILLARIALARAALADGDDRSVRSHVEAIKEERERRVSAEARIASNTLLEQMSPGKDSGGPNGARRRRAMV